MRLVRAGEQRISIDVPPQRRMRDPQIMENLFVEVVFAD